MGKLGWIWPSIIDIGSAKKASKEGLVACALFVGFNLLLGILAQFNTLIGELFSSYGLIDAFIFTIIGWGIYKLNRVAAVAGLAVYSLERLMMWADYGIKNPAVSILFILMFVNSLRGVFMYHKYSRRESVSQQTMESVNVEPPSR